MISLILDLGGHSSRSGRQVSHSNHNNSIMSLCHYVQSAKGDERRARPWRLLPVWPTPPREVPASSLNQSNWTKIEKSRPPWNFLTHKIPMNIYTRTHLNGLKHWGDRFLTQHIAVFLYWFFAIIKLVDHEFAALLGEAVEVEAVKTYERMLNEQTTE